MRSGYKDLICLLACAVNGITPDASAVRAMDIDGIYTLAKAHTLRGCVHTVLEKAGVEDEKFTQAYKKALRKIIYLDIERGAITEEMEKRGIWYMPLKGALLKDLYPETGMRKMTDIDLLFDASRAADNTIKRYYQSSGDKSRSGFIKARLFPEKEFMARRYPKLYPYPLLRPLAYIFRWGKGIAVNRVRLTAELKALKRYNKS